MGFTIKDYNFLKEKLPNNVLLNRVESEKYAQFSQIDPFHEIKESLLNGNDVAKYVITTGMLVPFVPEQLSGVTYTANFSGELYYYTPNGKPVHKTLLDDQKYNLPPNSITYLEIDTYFRVPHYMVLRFNLRVKNVYKGLLLGTGPIVDSGFEGKLFIPLHNLTSNTYVIQKGAKLIDIEFTKISPKDEWKPNTVLQEVINKFDFSAIPSIRAEIPIGRNFPEYIDSALKRNCDTSKPDFYVLNDEISVSSSLEEVVKKLRVEIKKSKKTSKEVKTSLEKNERREKIITTLSVVSIFGLLLSIFGVFITAKLYFTNAKDLSDAKQKIILQEEDYEKTIDTLTKQIELCQNDIAFEKVRAVALELRLADLIRQLNESHEGSE